MPSVNQEPAPRIVPVPVPESLDVPEASLLRGTVAVMREVTIAEHGHDDLVWSDRESLVLFEEDPHVRRLRFAAVVGEPAVVVGSAHVELPLQDNTHLADVDLGVLPDHRGRGIGTALHAEVARLVRAEGRSVVHVLADHRAEPEPDDPRAVHPSTGSGRAPGDSPGTRFARAHGYTLEQVYRHSVLATPVDPALLAQLRAESEERSGADYRLVTWEDRCPDPWVEPLAVLKTRMSTDAPSGGLDYGEDRWDADRVRAEEAREERQGRSSLAVAVEHVPSGTLAGYTALAAPAHTPASVFQHDTIVLADHRGHRLGQWLKAVNLERLAQRWPLVRRVHTWNAEENRHMLAINVRLGFRPAGGGAVWQLRLDAAADA